MDLPLPPKPIGPPNRDIRRDIGNVSIQFNGAFIIVVIVLILLFFN